MNKGKVKIHGKVYVTVGARIAAFRADHPDWSITTELVSIDDQQVIVKALVSNEEGRVLASDFAHELWASSNINKTSALENCSTSAVGRALAYLGYLGDDDLNVASANEVQAAIERPEKAPAEKPSNKGLSPKQKVAGLLQTLGVDQQDWAAYLKDINPTESVDWTAEDWGNIIDTLNSRLDRAA